LQFLSPFHPEILVIKFKQVLRPKFVKNSYILRLIYQILYYEYKKTTFLASAIIFLGITTRRRRIACWLQKNVHNPDVEKSITI
jgi:general stress protein CsbA